MAVIIYQYGVMVERRKWSSFDKSRIVLEGIKGRPVSDICTEPQLVNRCTIPGEIYSYPTWIMCLN